MIKRTFDVVMASLGLAVLSPLFVLLAVLIKLDSPGPVFFRQERVGRQFRRFFIYKFRTMVEDAPSRGGQITVGTDPRITRIGTAIRNIKLDELPQLINVFKGDMSFVGPRPEVPQFVELCKTDFESILRVKPGITDLASIKYRNEAEILSLAKDPQEEYLHRVLPDKIALAKEYVRQASFVSDLAIIIKTIFVLCQRTKR